MRAVRGGAPSAYRVGATVVVAIDHGPLLDAIGYRRGRFVRDVLADFSRVATAVLAR